MLLAETPGSFKVYDVRNEVVYTSVTDFVHDHVFRTDWISRVRIPCENLRHWDACVRSQEFEGCDLISTLLVKYTHKLY